VDWLIARETVIALAVLGAIASLSASILASRGAIDELWATRLNRLGYVFMAASMIGFIVAGFRAGR
jgi:hypothetical protein